MIYNRGRGKNKNFVIAEKLGKEYSGNLLGKYESVMCQGNGYMCVRGACEEVASNVGRYVLVAGTFNLLAGESCNELANSADFTAMDITVNGKRITMEECDTSSYLRELNLRTGLLTRGFNQGNVRIDFSRVVSMKKKHLYASKIRISCEKDADIIIRTGIDGNEIDKAAHQSFVEESIDGDKMTLITKTTQSDILFCTTTVLKLDHDYTVTNDKNNKKYGKTVTRTFKIKLKAGETLTVEKYATVYTNRDRERDGCSIYCLKDTSATAIKEAYEMGFDAIAEESAAEWDRKIWSQRDVKIDGNDEDQLAIRFALYHLTCMSPVHDNRMNIGAKGLSGPGYYGHAFWDTEIYMLPYFIFAAPEEARSLVEYRCNCLDAAREYAKKAGCKGARFAWESSWITDGESTPIWCDTGDLELHITSDVAFGAYYYYVVSGDEEFMENQGYELIFECAKYWASAVKYNAKRKVYEILGVIGPDEYSTNVNNNAYTNYFAQYTIQLALRFYKKLKKENKALFAKLNDKLDLDGANDDWKEKVNKIYLPRENKDGIIPQDDNYLNLIDVIEPGKRFYVDADVYKKACDYGFDKVQISKQADVVALFYMLEDLFTPECKKKNFYYYEARCCHHSSLSLSTYSALATDMKENDMAYMLFESATKIDMQDGGDSNPGVHSASLGGMWQCCVLGFGGVRRYGNELRIQPNIPEKWNNLSFRINWHGQTLEITEDHEKFSVRNITGTADVQFLYNGKVCSVGEGITIKY